MSAAEPGLSAGKREHVDRKLGVDLQLIGASNLRHCSEQKTDTGTTRSMVWSFGALKL
jgi:hypothetical protein